MAKDRKNVDPDKVEAPPGETEDSGAGRTTAAAEPGVEGGGGTQGRRGRRGGRTALVAGGERPPQNLFLLPIENAVVFPELVVPLALRSERSRRTVEQARAQTDFLGLMPASEVPEDGEVDPSSLGSIGCVARVLRMLKMPDDSTSVVLRGMRRFRIQKILRTAPYLIARVDYPEETRAGTDETQAMERTLQGLVRKILASDSSVPDEFKVAAANIEGPGALADFAATYFVRDPQQRRGLLEMLDVQDRLEQVITLLTREVGLLELGKRIHDQIRDRLEKQQRDFFLREQLKEIRKELGEAKDEKAVAIERIEERLKEIELPEAARRRAGEELERLRLLPLESPEAAVIRNYLEWIVALPWNRATDDEKDLAKAERVLRKSHHGLEEIKDRIVEFLAVRQLKPDHRGPILCLAGPPGVGKTSLGKAIAESLGRKFVRVSLGGMRDEAEIRGHRRTYVGAMPGRILQGMKSAGSNNPVFMLDEIDKLGADFRGDPSAALLEALDPEQNQAFSDHFLEMPFDLSRVMFVATANNLATIPPALLDRLEVLELQGYTAHEKVGIAKEYLVPRQLERHGLSRARLKFPDRTLRRLLEGWTREAGVRNLEQQIARVCRKVATRAARGATGGVTVTPEMLREYLGPPRFLDDQSLHTDRPGVAIGLSWTPYGGEALSIEAAAAPGNGKLVLTGMLGDVMLESAKIALSYLRGLGEVFGFDEPDLTRTDLHVHVPAGAIPKDGPSAGVTLACALLSLFRGEAPRKRVAMTGELTLTGCVLAVGGLKGKLLAARRAGMRHIVLPAANRPQIEELKPEVKKGLELHFVADFPELAAIVFPGNVRLTKPPVAKPAVRGRKGAGRARPAPELRRSGRGKPREGGASRHRSEDSE